ncbi:hypothetical protein DKX38_026735 [Salix brachista]|uniref:Retrotransposon Copia-like N-terminal domain-containing protein n=1 Tax=Salix brachista TaxID=2182728 RepID=A0A5N5JM02_9ROSI|nr:hypothetical protein DKX38_026735 [Salix brachista]
MSKSDSETSGTKSNPIIIQHEGSSFNAGIVLNETNYDLWSQMLEMQIAEKEKLSFIRGTSPPPKEEDEGYEKWYSDNQKVKRWLLMSMSPEIMKRYIRLPTARDIWKALSKAFYDGADELQVFTLNQKAFSAKQNGRSLSIYYGELTEIFSELDHRDKVVMVDETDIASYQKVLQRQRVHIFLAGLEGDFEQVRGEILRKDPIPELEECYALVRREDVRRGVMNGQLENSEASAMVTRNRSNQNWPPQHQQEQKRPIHPKTTNGGDKSSYKCTHCDQTGHTKSRCYELVGYPEWWDHNRDFRKKNSKRASTAAIVETKIEDDSSEESSALAAATVFHEDSMYFSSEPELQGEYMEEVQALDYDFLISIEGELSEPGNNPNGNEEERPETGDKNAGELDLSGINLDHRGDEHDEDPENALVDQPPSESLAPQATDTPNQSPAEDGPDHWSMSIGQRMQPVDYRNSNRLHLSIASLRCISSSL